MRFISLLILICICGSLKAQSYYFYVYETEVKGVSTIYRSLVNLQPDGTAIARVQYNDKNSGKLFLYEIKLVDSSLANEGDESKYLIPVEPAKPLLEADGSAFSVPRFKFTKFKDSSVSYYEPSGVDAFVSEKWLTTKLTTHSEKLFEELKNDPDLINSFYFETDAFYQFVFDESTRAVPLPRKEKMFLLIVANTNDETVGKSVATDLKNVKETFTDLARALGVVNIYPIYIEGDGYSKSAVEAALARIEAQKPSSKDIIIFYFSGHGFRLPNQKSDLALMSFRTPLNRLKKEVGEYIALEEVNKRITALKPGISIVLADCCNANIYENPVLGTDMIRPKGGGTLGAFNLQSGNKLFFPPAPLSILIGTTHKGNLSVGHPETGGYFTHYFLAELQKNLWGYYANSFLSVGGQSSASWLNISKVARENTYWKSKAKQCGATANDRCIQEADIFVIPPQ